MDSLQSFRVWCPRGFTWPNKRGLSQKSWRFFPCEIPFFFPEQSCRCPSAGKVRSRFLILSKVLKNCSQLWRSLTRALSCRSARICTALARSPKFTRWSACPTETWSRFSKGSDRIRVLEVIGLKPFLRARVESQPDLEDQPDAELTALERNVQELFREVVARSPQLSDDLQTEATNIDSPARLADFVASTLPSLNTMVRQELLETFSVRKRLETLISELSKEKEVLELRNKIHDQVQEQVNQSQREFLLREQMKAIQKELGESEDGQTEVEELRKKVEESGHVRRGEKGMRARTEAPREDDSGFGRVHGFADVSRMDDLAAVE